VVLMLVDQRRVRPTIAYDAAVGHIMAIVSKAVFEKDLRGAKVGDCYPIEVYRSQHATLDALAGGGRLWLVTVRPGDALWLVGVLRDPDKTKQGWVAANATSIIDISHLKSKLEFASGAGLPNEAGKLGMALQTPRALSSGDVELLEAALGAAASMPDPRDELRMAYELLLDRPIADFDPDATYVLYVWDDIYSSEFEWSAAALKKLRTMSKSRRAREGDAKAPEGMGWDRYDFDLARSYFTIEDIEGNAGNELRKAGGKAGIVTGEQLATIAAKHGGLKGLVAEEEDDELMIQILARVKTDGTLLDALAAATWTMSAPDGLVEWDTYAEVHGDWADKLDAIQDDKLRTHFKMLCQDENAARCCGAFYVGRDCPGDLQGIKQLGHQVIAAWEFGEGQAASAIFQLRP